jgi:formylglycine-generating enzyme required for sulfatase activity
MQKQLRTLFNILFVALGLALFLAGNAAAQGKTVTVTLPGGVPLEMVRIPSGKYLMGSPEGEQDRSEREGPQRLVSINKVFYLGKYEVTKAQWKAVMGTTVWPAGEGAQEDPHSPATNVSWNQAQQFIAALNKLDQGTFRLPSEAEWEYAARAGATTRFYWGDDPNYKQIHDYAWWRGNAWDTGNRYAHKVGTKLPNTWGLYDMSGNVWEWCEDDYYGDYNGAPSDASARVDSPRGENRVLRGGGWYYSGSSCRSAIRSWNTPDKTSSYYGFRVVRTK